MMLSIFNALLALYLGWLVWQYVDRLQAVAGGKTRSLHRWSRLHLRMDRLSAAAAVFAALIEIANWLLSRGMLHGPVLGMS
jgi:hypothetical protein